MSAGCEGVTREDLDCDGTADIRYSFENGAVQRRSLK